MGTTDLRAELEAIHEQHGRLTPELVLDQARDKKHPLHSRFEWDNRIAGNRWRRYQAHELIQSVRVKYVAGDGREGDVRAFHAMRSGDGFVYEAAETIATDPLQRTLLLREMERDWRALRSRYAHFAKFAELLQAHLDESAA